MKHTHIWETITLRAPLNPMFTLRETAYIIIGTNKIVLLKVENVHNIHTRIHYKIFHHVDTKSLDHHGFLFHDGTYLDLCNPSLTWIFNPDYDIHNKS